MLGTTGIFDPNAKVVRWGYRGKSARGIILQIADNRENPAIGELRRELALRAGKKTPDNHESYQVHIPETFHRPASNLFLVFSDCQMYICTELVDGDCPQEPTGDTEIL